MRRLRRRPRFSVALVGVVVGLTGLTALAVGGVAWIDQRGRSAVLHDTATALAARRAASEIARFLRHAEATVSLGPELVARGALDPSDDAALERFVLSVLRVHPHLSWVSYGDRDDRFVGAWRDAGGHLYVNRSFPRGDRIRLEEDMILPDGGRMASRRSDDHGYRPRERPHYRLAALEREVVWTGPYEFYGSGGAGVTCAAPLLDGQGRVRGVFTVDFSLRHLGDFLDAVQVSPRGRAFLATRSGALVAAAGSGPALAQTADLAAAASRAARAETPLTVSLDGERYRVRSVALGVPEPPWLVHVAVPERDYTEPVDAQARRSGLLALGALGLAVGTGLGMARWLARPLRELADAARRIRGGELDLVLTPRSRDEIGVLTRAVADMARALRDRDFIRETFGRYVSPEVAEQFLRDRDALRLGGELRAVTILMSDLRGFSVLSERLGPETMITVLNRYLASMTPVILEHGGLINEFIGDAILVLFGAPLARPDDTERAVRCARAMQQTLAGLNDEHRRSGLPELAMGIGLHHGEVVAGNIGTTERAKYGVVGSAVNVAARLQALSRAGEIVASEAVVVRAGAGAAFGDPAEVRLRGLQAPVRVFRLRPQPPR